MPVQQQPTRMQLQRQRLRSSSAVRAGYSQHLVPTAPSQIWTQIRSKGSMWAQTPRSAAWTSTRIALCLATAILAARAMVADSAPATTDGDQQMILPPIARLTAPRGHALLERRGWTSQRRRLPLTESLSAQIKASAIAQVATVSVTLVSLAMPASESNVQRLETESVLVTVDACRSSGWRR